MGGLFVNIFCNFFRESMITRIFNNLYHLLFLLLFLSAARAQTLGEPSFHGAAAFSDARQATWFGERPSGSTAIGQLRTWIVSQLKPLHGNISLDSFVAQTPAGPAAMANIVLEFPGNSGRAIAITGHYDTKRIAMVHFVGANDGGSSTGFLLEFARTVSNLKHSDTIYIVFFDGEEAVLRDWSDTDSRYGSRHLAAKWRADGTLSQIKALINIDMIGDQDLDLANDENSSQSLRAMFRGIAAKLGYTKYFRKDPGAIDDDHKPFADAGVNVIDIIDLDYGPRGSYWHTADDTIDKLSVHSFQLVGNIVLAAVKQLDQRRDE
jgi:Zn-dependent M28 family amino/carboxypeptidase